MKVLEIMGLSFSKLSFKVDNSYIYKKYNSVMLHKNTLEAG